MTIDEEYKGCRNCKHQPEPLQTCDWLKHQIIFYKVCPMWELKESDVKMTIDEAIRKYKDICDINDDCPRYCMMCSCDECVQECGQIAEWLEELKIYKSDEFTSDWLQKLAYHQGYSQAESDYFENTQIDRESSYKIGHKIGYNKAIDDFVKACKENTMYKTFGLRECDIEKIAEQLKAGGENE